MTSAFRWVLAIVSALTMTAVSQAQYSIKSVNEAVPQEVNAEIRKQIADASVQFLDGKGNLVAQFWLAKAVLSDATPEQIKNGLTYRELKETGVLGVAKFDQPWTDYRKQKIKPGVYTLRLAYQPMDGDHMGTSPYPDFALLVAAKKDSKPGTMEAKSLVEMSTATMGTSHPGVIMLAPNTKPSPKPELAKRENNNWVINTQVGISAGGGTGGVIGVGLTVVGHAD
jgi:hypothetical protein